MEEDKQQYGVIRLSDHQLRLVPSAEAQIRNLEKLSTVYEDKLEYRNSILKSIVNNSIKGRL